MPETQETIGHHTETSANDTKRGGREIPTEPQDGKIGTLHHESANPKPRGGAEPGNNTLSGYRDDGQADTPTRRANDHIKKISDQY